MISRALSPGILVSLALLVALGACGPTRPAGQASAPAAQPADGATVRREGPSITFKFASSSPEADLSGVAFRHWAKLVEERTGGRIKFQFFWAGALLSSQQMFQGIRDGLADFGQPSMATVSGQIPDVAVFEVPFAYPTDLDLTLPFYREVEPVLDEMFAQNYNQRVIWSNPSTTPDPVSCRHKFLDSPQAWQGALVRTAGKWQGRTLEEWGGKSVVIDIGDAYTAIQRGTAECLLLVYNLLDSFKLYEVAKYVTRIDHSINLSLVTANANSWSRLPPEDQQILLQAGRDAQEFILNERVDYVTKTLDKFKAQGVNVCTPTQQELVRLRNATDTVLEEIARLQTDKGHRLQQIAREYRAKVPRWGPTEGDMTPCPAS